MSSAISFIEKNSFFDDSNDEQLGDIIENISVVDAITACKIQELETLKSIKEYSVFIDLPPSNLLARILQLEKELKNIKY